MHLRHERKIKINKKQLIDKIRENKAEHIKEFDEAVIAYKIEALRLLEKAKVDVEGGSLKIHVTLTTPVNRSEDYEKVAQMFEWEIADEIELSQSEFNDYVHDDSDVSRNTKFTNSVYFANSLR